MHLALRAVAATALTGAAGTGYAMAEARSYRLRQVEVPALAPGSAPLRVLHLSDLHLRPEQTSKIAWVRRLARLEPDLVIDTGDNLAGTRSVPAVIETLAPLLELPGAFVFGSNDYFAPTPRNPLTYLRRGGSAHDLEAPEDWIGDELPWPELRDHLTEAGWLDLTNAQGSLEVAGRAIALRGVDDPHIQRDDYARIAGPARGTADLRIGVVHAPYQRVLDAMSHDSADLILAGHTHGGQLRLPLSPVALVTNCDIPRGQARGLSRWGASWLHVSAGLGTSPYVRVRFACPPEATLLTLLPMETPSVPARSR